MIKKVWLGTAILILLIGLSSCNKSPDAAERIKPSSDSRAVDQQSFEETASREAMESLSAFETAADMLTVIKNRDYQSLAEYVHPEKGIKFFPYPDGDYKKTPTFNTEQIKGFNAETVYDWGCYDANDDRIKMTVDEYFEDFVYDKDFLSCRQISMNSIVRSGNCPEIAVEAFPDSIFVDFHEEGLTEFDGLDWASIHYKNRWKLISRELMPMDNITIRFIKQG